MSTRVCENGHVVERDDLCYWFGCMVAWLGNLLLVVALVGYGVRFGREAADV
ncbi:hypothetical protein [Nocardioides sp. SYSU D00038]|uniref:hypothetical protein n=1 Tax=Nocardioides sp. SYSU D00038 TaxID=2812554 RepID=UPI0019677B8F|nr:hypothetical protein [Nocardioides sp. SYSU D00038]